MRRRRTLADRDAPQLVDDRMTAPLDTVSRNPHAGLPFDDDDAAIARALEDVSIPALQEP